MTYSDAKPNYTNTSLEHLIAEINFQRSKDARQLLKDKSKYNMVPILTFKLSISTSLSPCTI